jgi:arylsulfate sulfotransferase
LLFDNGNFRSLPPKTKMAGRDSYSRVMELAIDAKAKTARQVWKYGGPGDGIFFSPFISEADLLPNTGNLLVTDGGRVLDKDGHLSDDIAKGHHAARIAEVTYADPPQKVFELVVESGEKDDPIGWAVYRSERLPAFPAIAPPTTPAGK